MTPADRLAEALREIADPLRYMRDRAHAGGRRLSGQAYAIALDPSYLQSIARRALEELADGEAAGPSPRNHASPGPGMPPSSGSHVPPGFNMGSEHDFSRFESEP